MEQDIKQKLEKLARLQVIDKQLNKIYHLRGDLPFEVQDLEDVIESLNLKINDYQEKIDANKKSIAGYKSAIKDQEELLKKFNEQQMNVKNSREYDAINKEIEIANLEIQALKRKISICEKQNGEFKEMLDVYQEKKKEKLSDLDIKKMELQQIMTQTQKDESHLLTIREKLQAEVDARLLASYERIKRNMRNGIALATTDRDACGGCFAVVPPQRIYEVKLLKKIIVCENCGRILVNHTLMDEARQSLNIHEIEEEFS